MFLRTSGVQVWQHYQKLYDQTLNEILRFWYFKKSLKMFLWIRRNEFYEYRFLRFYLL